MIVLAPILTELVPPYLLVESISKHKRAPIGAVASTQQRHGFLVIGLLVHAESVLRRCDLVDVLNERLLLGECRYRLEWLMRHKVQLRVHMLVRVDSHPHRCVHVLLQLLLLLV